MLRSYLKFPVILMCIFTLATCIDPYYPELKRYQSLLVVEGLMTDAGDQARVRLTRTFTSVDSIPEKISDATVFVTDETGSRADLEYKGDGFYESEESSGFKGEAGKTYTLHIETADGKKYLSEPCPLVPGPVIDSLYYSREEVFDKTNGTKAGIKIMVDTERDWEDAGYLRWEYTETWKFRLPSVKEYNYITDTEIIQLPVIREFCWKENKSKEILINSVSTGRSSLTGEQIVFIPTGESDRMSIQYSILVRQFSMSASEFNFWDNLRQVNEAGGNVYDSQPYPVVSNIYNPDDPEEKVLGYFRVSAVSEKRLYITAEEIRGMDLPTYTYPCIQFVVSPENYPPTHELEEPITWDGINEMFMAAGGFLFVKPVYVGDTDILYKLVFASEECSDCTLTGSAEPPDFWINLP